MISKDEIPLLRQNDAKLPVIRWQEFKVQKPIDAQKIVVANFRRGSVIIMEWSERFSHLITEDDWWIDAPAIV